MSRLALCGVLAIVTLAYSNHWHNSFHFDDGHSVVDNVFIRDVHNIPRFFTDATTSTALPANRSWRPIVISSFAIDYWLAGGLKPVWFHGSTFIWFLCLVLLIYALTRKLIGELEALFAATLFGVHPAIAETVNYIVQRGEVYSTFGVIAGITLYVYGFRRGYVYLVPVIFGVLSKPPALVFVFILFVYVFLFESINTREAIRKCIPALICTIVLGAITVLMIPSAYDPTHGSAINYWISQPLAWLRYFVAFFAPVSLSADTDHVAVTEITSDAFLGFVFAVALVCVAWWCRHRFRAISFGLFWFMLALIPASTMALAEVENDHRMFFPFVGLAITASSAMSIMIRRISVRNAISAAILVVAIYGTLQRNAVWHTEESLWRDVTIKSPRNGRGLMNYGLTLMARADYQGALDYFTRAHVLTPDYATLEVNLGIVNGAIKNRSQAETHFRRALALSPNDAVPSFYYANWLKSEGRISESSAWMNRAITLNQAYRENYK